MRTDIHKVLARNLVNLKMNVITIALIECLALDADIIATRVRHHSPELVFIYVR